jgi:hypothetical protein
MAIFGVVFKTKQAGLRLAGDLAELAKRGLGEFPLEVVRVDAPERGELALPCREPTWLWVAKRFDVQVDNALLLQPRGKGGLGEALLSRQRKFANIGETPYLGLLERPDERLDGSAFVSDGGQCRH